MATLAEVAADGRLKALEALRDRLAKDIDDCDSKRDLAALSQRFMDVLEQIAEVQREQPPQKGTVLDEFSRRRQQQEAAGASSTAKRQQRGR